MSFWSRFSKNRAKSELGYVLVQLGFVDEDKVSKAMQAQRSQQKDAARPERLGEILMEMGYLTRHQLDSALRAQRLLAKGKDADAMLCIVEARTQLIHDLVSTV